MSPSEELDNIEPEFHWGKKRGIGGAKKDIQFYESFTFDGINYSLYDCVYLFKKGELEPYIGKIVKIWEQTDGKKRGMKRVKLLWFFHPSEIQNYLGDNVPLEKEIFLASGEGVGVFNANPLEAIAGKCCVVCSSKDERNRQPSEEALKLADYIFYRTFDVGNYTISEKIADKIAGVEVKLLLNRDEDLTPSSVFKLEANGIDEKAKTNSDPVLSNLPHPDSLNLVENKLKDEKLGCIPNSTSKNDVSEGKHLEEGKHLLVENNASIFKHDLVGGKESTALASHVEESLKSSKKKALSVVSEEKPSKKIRLNDDSARLLDVPESKNATGTRKLKIDSDEYDSGMDSIQLHKDSSEKVKHSDKKGSPAVSMENDAKIDNKIVEVSRKPDADRRRWFKALPWQPQIQNADGQGTLVFLDNLDPSFTSGEIEDVIYSALKQSCTAKAIQQGTFQNPHYGQAYIIFNTVDAADQALEKINTGCLMLPGGRPLVASRGMLKLPPKQPTFTGHLTIDKLKLQLREEWKKAVATSHCSQPNTIEYEMAMDWMLVQEKSVNCFNRLHKVHGEHRNHVKKSLKTK